jgi:hypothetical protein
MTAGISIRDITTKAIPEVGDPASIRVGSDVYPAIVAKVVLFKSGERKGAVRLVEATRIGHGPEAVIESHETGGYGCNLTIDVNHPSVVVGNYKEAFFADKYGNLQHEGLRLHIGRARYYQDPHF